MKTISSIQDNIKKRRDQHKSRRKSNRKSMREFEDEQTNDPNDDVVGPALATGSKMVRDIFINKADDDGPMFDPSGVIGGVTKKVGKVAKRSMAELAEEASRSKDTVYSRLLAKIKGKDTDKIESKINKNDFSSDVSLSDLTREQKEAYLFFQATKQPKKKLEILKEAKINKDKVKKAEAAQPSQHDIYDKSTLTTILPTQRK